MDVNTLRIIIGLSIFLFLGYLVQFISFIKRSVINLKIWNNKVVSRSDLFWKDPEWKDGILFTIPLGISLIILIGNKNPPLYAWILLGFAILMFVLALVYFVMSVVVDSSEVGY